jgi:hypothetical protein
VLDLLAAHPSTARHIATKLARRFVADQPPEPLVDQLARTFRETGGDIRELLRVLLAAEAFWAPPTPRAKLKTPFEYVASLLRAGEAELAPLALASDASRPAMALGLLGVLREMGQPPYGAQPPTGYPETAADWLSTGGLLQRMKVALAFAAGKLPGVEARSEIGPPEGQPLEEYVVALATRLLGRPPQPSTVATLLAEAAMPPEERTRLGLPPHRATDGEARGRLALAWLLASPEFQWR